MLKRPFRSLYLKIFLSFLATCILFFVGLALFWNAYFYDLFFKDKKALLESRASEVSQILTSYQEGVMSVRELRFGIRLIARSFNGQIWIADTKGNIQYASVPEREGKTVPRTLDEALRHAAKNRPGYTVKQLADIDGKPLGSFLTYSRLTTVNKQAYVVFYHTPVTDIFDLIRAVRLNIWLPLLFSLLAVGVILYTLSRKLAGPLQQMNKAALSLASGDFSARVSVATKDEVGQLAQSFNFMVEQLQQWEDTRQEFLTNVSHELRSPLTTLRGLIAAMNDKVIPEEQLPHYLKICDYEVQRLQRLVSELLDLAKIQNNPDVFRIERLDVVRKTKETIDLLIPSFEKKGIGLEVWIPDESNGKIYADLDPDRYSQILNNLLYNAMQFTPEGKKVTVTLGEDEGDLSIQVRDEGIGMSEEEAARIWDRFYKADPSRSGYTEGTGLGLTITRHLVTGMQGRVDVTSHLGKGSEFTVRFPLSRIHESGA